MAFQKLLRSNKIKRSTYLSVLAKNYMNKADLSEAVFNKLGGTKKAAEDAVDTVFHTITTALSRGEEVSVSGFGTFLSKKRAARTARNPRTGETVQVPATTVPKFRAGKGLKDAVK